MNLFLWGALPYIAFTFLIVGTLVRFFYFERNWTTKSSEFLEKKLSELEVSFEGKEIPRPENWGGYIAKPYEIEFWQGRPNRLHDRILYQLQPDFDWKISRLAP